MSACSCSCHPHTQWGPDGSTEQRENHPDGPCCVCCGASPQGFFVSEQEAVAEEAAWADQMEQEASHEVAVMTVDSALAILDDDIDPPVNPLDIPDEYDLPMYGSIIACPKCGNDKVKTEYHAGGVLSEPCGKRFGWPNVQNLGEHLCRTCTRCKYGWPEECASGA